MSASPIVNNKLTVHKLSYYNYTSPLEFREVELKGYSETSFLGPTQILIKTKASSLNPVDVILYQLTPTWLKKDVLKGFGSDYAGEVLQTGSEVKDYKEGDRVYGDLLKPFGPNGAFSDYLVLDVTKEDKIGKIPDNLSYQEAAALPIAFGTAYELITKNHNVKGANVIVFGAGTSVGTYGVEIAKYLGAKTVLATCSPKSAAKAKEYGADVIVDYTKGAEHEYKEITEFVKKNGKFDLIFDSCRDPVFMGRLKDVLKTRKEGGKYVQVFGSTTMDYRTVTVASNLPTKGIMRELVASRLPFSKYEFISASISDGGDFIKAVADLSASNKLKIPIDSVFKPKDYKKALDKFYSGSFKGKLVFDFE